MKAIKNQITKIETLKRKLISSYVNLLLLILLMYSIIFYFFIENNQLALYDFCGFCLLLYTWLIVRKNYSIEKAVHLFLMTSSIFNMFLILLFSKQSIANYMWLLPIPLAAHIFFSKKTFIFYTIYVFANILIIKIISALVNLNLPILLNSNQILLFDTLVFIFNLIVIFLLLYYNEKIKKEEIILTYLPNSEQLNPNETKESTDEDYIKYKELFEQINTIISEKSYYKDADFNVAKLSIILNTNAMYIAKAIKQERSFNFTTYLNTYRINHFKQLIAENNLKKVTLMYLYTDSGFSNQSTFNRVFKQIEGITPTEYISQIEN